MLRDASYDGERNLLTLTFISGNIYGYTGVPENVVRELLAAPSKGQYFNANIRDEYPYSRLSKGQ